MLSNVYPHLSPESNRTLEIQEINQDDSIGLDNNYANHPGDKRRRYVVKQTLSNHHI